MWSVMVGRIFYIHCGTNKRINSETVYRGTENMSKHQTKEQTDLRIQPIAIFAFFGCLMAVINEHLVWVSGILFFSLTAATYTAIYHFSHNKEVKDYYFVFTIIAVILTFLINLEATEIVTAIINTLLVSYLLL